MSLSVIKVKLCIPEAVLKYFTYLSDTVKAYNKCRIILSSVPNIGNIKYITWVYNQMETKEMKFKTEASKQF